MYSDLFHLTILLVFYISYVCLDSFFNFFFVFGSFQLNSSLGSPAGRKFPGTIPLARYRWIKHSLLCQARVARFPPPPPPPVATSRGLGNEVARASLGNSWRYGVEPGENRGLSEIHPPKYLFSPGKQISAIWR